MTTVAIVDNYDSFTFNLVHAIGGLGAEVVVHRNDALTADELLASQPDAIVLSPGPCTPNEAGISLDVVRKAASDVPIFGVCLGHQTIGQAFGGHVIRAPAPMHGKLSDVRHKARGVFRGLNGSFKATRYHSLIVERSTLPDELEVTAETDDGLIMGMSHKDLPVHGVQFHPESIASENGVAILATFLDLANIWNRERRGRAA